MAESGLDSLRETHAVNVEWRAYELRPEGSPPMSEAHRQKILAGWPRVQAIARERFGLEMRRAEGEVNHSTRLAHIGAKFAIAQGQGEAYHKAVFRAHWQELRDISSIDTLAAIAGTVGLDEADFRAALTNAEYIAEVEGDEYWAYQQGLGGVPAFIFGNRYLVSGAQPAEVLRQVADKCIEEGLTLER
jgi:predicted DsbA family dithiol-disulfide isomerase